MNNAIMKGNGLFASAPAYHGNKIVVSQLQHYEQVEKQSSQVSIKYVLSGTEHYTLQRTTYSIKEDHFLIVNRGQYLETTLKGTEPIMGLCIFFEDHFLRDVYVNKTKSEEALLEYPLQPTPAIPSFDFFEDAFHSSENTLGEFVRTLAEGASKGRLFDHADPTVYYTIAEKFLESQHLLGQEMSRLQTLKRSTQKELYKRLRLAKQFMDECHLQKLDIPALAKLASLSEFHFFRTFKRAFQVSPYQYILKKRLHHALMLLEQQHLSITDVAFTTGFADVHSFSKAFKKMFGYPPSQVKISSF